MSDRFKFRLFNKLDNSYCVGVHLIGGGDMIHEAVSSENWNNAGCFIIEQCTGLKDKNGNLIYEGDVVDYFGEPATIVWDCCGFKIKTNDDICHEFYRNDIEIIGDIHETKENK